MRPSKTTLPFDFMGLDGATLAEFVRHAARIVGIPRDPDTLADILLERGLAIPRQEGDQTRRDGPSHRSPWRRTGRP